MDSYRHFETETKPLWYAIISALSTLATAAAAAAALWFFTKNPSSTIYVLAMSVPLSAVMALVLSKKPPVRLIFEGKQLTVLDQNGQQYHLSRLSSGDLQLKQGSREKKYNVGRLVIKPKGLSFCGIRNFSDLATYIQENYPNNT